MSHPIRKILVPVDFSSCSDEALVFADTLAKAVGATLEVVHVWEAPMYAGAEHVVVRTQDGAHLTVLQVVHREAMRELDEFVSRMGKKGLAVKGRLLAGDPADVIAAEAKDYDLVVMGTHGRRGIARIFLGSVAENLVRTCPCPVLTVRGSAAKDA